MGGGYSNVGRLPVHPLSLALGMVGSWEFVSDGRGEVRGQPKKAAALAETGNGFGRPCFSLLPSTLRKKGP